MREEKGGGRNGVGKRGSGKREGNKYLVSRTCIDSLTRVLSKLSSALKKHTGGQQHCGQSVVDLHSPGREEWEIEVGLQGGEEREGKGGEEGTACCEGGRG